MTTYQSPPAQASDEPMTWQKRYDLGASEEAAMLAEIQDWRARFATPRATVDVELNAARYQYLRDHHIGDDPESINLDAAKRPGLDAAIDAAIAATKGAKP